MSEFVSINPDGVECDWIDPVVTLTEDPSGYTVDNGFGSYRVDRQPQWTYLVREGGHMSPLTRVDALVAAVILAHHPRRQTQPQTEHETETEPQPAASTPNHDLLDVPLTKKA